MKQFDYVEEIQKLNIRVNALEALVKDRKAIVKEHVCAYIDGKWIETRDRNSKGEWSGWYTINEISEFEDYGEYDNTEFRLKENKDESN